MGVFALVIVLIKMDVKAIRKDIKKMRMNG
jgi:hypothetical protein